MSHLTNDATAFARAMLEEAGVAATPGVDFDAERGHRYLRFCYAGTAAAEGAPSRDGSPPEPAQSRAPLWANAKYVAERFNEG